MLVVTVIPQIGMYHRYSALSRPRPAEPPSTNHVSECGESIEHVRVWTISFPHQAVRITLQIERAGCPIAASRAISLYLVKDFGEFAPEHIDVEAQDFQPAP